MRRCCRSSLPPPSNNEPGCSLLQAAATANGSQGRPACWIACSCGPARLYLFHVWRYEEQHWNAACIRKGKIYRVEPGPSTKVIQLHHIFPHSCRPISLSELYHGTGARSNNRCASLNCKAALSSSPPPPPLLAENARHGAQTLCKYNLLQRGAV